MGKRKRHDTEQTDPSQRQAKIHVPAALGMASAAPSVITAAEAELRVVMDDFVNVYERLDQADDADKKPNYSYTEMIYLAILRSPNFCLPITEIYKYIKNRFSYFRSPARKHWNNAVRHSLSKTKCFTKIAVGRGSSGHHNLNRSTYLWCIIPGSIVNFARGDYRPNVDTESGTNTLRWGYFRVNAGQFWEQVAVYLEKKMEVFKNMIMTTHSPGKVLEDQACYLQGCPLSATYSQGFIEGIYNTRAQPTGTVHHGPNESRLDANLVLSTKTITLQADDSSTDSGNESLLTKHHDISTNSSLTTSSVTSPVAEPAENSNDPVTAYQKPTRQCLPVNVASLDDSRKTPELPDLGHVSPLTISPTLSPIGNISSYENDSGLGTSFLQTAPPTSFASTPIVTSLSQQRFMYQPPPFTGTISPPLFTSLSPPNMSPLDHMTALPPLQINHKLPTPPLQSTLGSTSSGYQSAFTPRSSLSPPFYMPHPGPHPTGSYDLLSYPAPFLPTPVSYHNDYIPHYPTPHDSALSHYARHETTQGHVGPYHDWGLS